MNKYHDIIHSYIAGSLISVSPNGSELYYAEETDLGAIESLRRRNSGELGFIPKDVYESIAKKERVANRDRWKSQNLIVCKDNGDQTGFCLSSFYQPTHTEIVQICVREDARRMERALLMADFVEDRSRQIKKPMIRARVACDIDAVNFWKAIGYEIKEVVTSSFLNRAESKSKRPLYIFEKELKYESIILNNQ